MLRTTIVASAVTLALGACREHPSGPPPHAHDDSHGGEAVTTLALDDGKKWPTDAPLRAGMSSIRDQLQAGIAPIPAGTYSARDYASLAAAIDREVSGIVTRCKLPPAVDARFHVVLAQIETGADLMKKDGDRRAGAVKVLGALEQYETFFDHPGWKPIEH